jgi:hypothetical protein
MDWIHLAQYILCAQLMHLWIPYKAGGGLSLLRGQLLNFQEGPHQISNEWFDFSVKLNCKYVYTRPVMSVCNELYICHNAIWNLKNVGK